MIRFELCLEKVSRHVKLAYDSPKTTKLPRPIGQEISTSLEAVPKKTTNPKIQRHPKGHSSRQSPKNTEAHEPANEHILRDNPKKTKTYRPRNEHNKTNKNNDSELFQRPFLETAPMAWNLWFVSFGTVSKKYVNLKAYGFWYFWLRLSREICSFPMSEGFRFHCFLAFGDCLDEKARFVANGFWYFCFFGDCLEEYAHFVAYGFWCFWFSGAVSRNTLLSDFGEAPESLFLFFWGLWVWCFCFFWDCLEELGDSPC